MDWLDLLAVQGTLKSILQQHSSKASILWCSTFFIVQLSHPYMTTGKTVALTIHIFDCVDYNKLCKILKVMGIPDHLACFLRNLYAGQEATFRSGYGATNWFQIGKGVRQGSILSPCLFNLYGVGTLRGGDMRLVL